MSTLSLDADEFRTLESLRQRLATLTANLKSLQDNIARSNPLPTPSSLQASARIAQQNLFSLHNLLTDRQDLFARLAVHPSTNFPGREHEMILQNILRKKLEPDVEGWVEECRDTAVRAGVEVSKSGKVGKRRGEEEEEEEEEDEEGYRPEDEDDVGGDPLTDLWADVRDALMGRITEFVEGESQDVYTVEEREMGVENVRTGLKRDLEEEEEESEDEDEEGEKVDEDEDVVMLGPGGAPAAKPPVAQSQNQGPRVEPEHVLWFGVRGDFSLPGNIETETTRKARAGAGRRGGPGR
ncbi:hypothetical protein CONLIGDRAFT_647660 [Coniochaeta ligniaria NRRL 30616]|uniref:Mediator of RNA polymerase II transcription subunit 8 n=1 Tax=Coniochaeta ligniaria NRRL 30616 TaxID=1408157 RepID=A0A1J7JEC0_9PEZI|nr:hypothetical protein CONLIGDRAFT_647660 [Coniochaeta ligniaria NRRL 30616]